MRPKYDLINQQFGRLLVTSRAGTRNKAVMWHCQCSCGNTHTAATSNLVSGKVSSCGCYQGETASTHGLSNTRIYSIWLEMNRRCEDPSHPMYKYYGGKGITVCKRWKNSPLAFLEDMGKPPSPTHTIERRENSKGYTAENCRWATPKEQANNRSNNVLITWQGRTMTMRQWSEELGINYQTLRYRVNHGWSASEALTGART